MGSIKKTIRNGLCSIIFLTITGCTTAPVDSPKPPEPAPVKPVVVSPLKAENHDEAAPKKADMAIVKPSMKFTTWLKGVKKEARKKGIRQDILDRAFVGVKPIPRIIELDRRQPEFSMTFQQYLDRVVPKSRVQKGQKKFGANRANLELVGKKYGVQPRFITALWGIETDFGRTLGGFKVVESLATLAYDGRRSKYFRKELMNALKILNQGHIAPEDMKGSWAGAMGQSQFMPSSFLSYAQDFDGDGHKDIWTTQADVFASAANYLSKSGWNASMTWGREVSLPKGLNTTDLATLKVRKPLSAWQSLGIRTLDGTNLPGRELSASLVMPDGEKGRAYLVYENFRTIMKWNRSTYFALAVGRLADGIGGL